MKVAAIVTDLMLYSRIESAARVAGAELARVDTPAGIPPDAELVLVDWSARDAGWGTQIAAWRDRTPDRRVVVFGPHTDLEAHAAARRAGMSPMWARSKLIRELSGLFDRRLSRNAAARRPHRL